MLHEIGHFIAAFIVHAKIIKFRISLFGINMQINTNDLSLNKKLALFFSGPFVNLLIMVYFYNIFYDIAYINIFLSLINLLPIVPLDGGNVLKSVLEQYVKRKYVYRITLTVNIIFLIIVAYYFYLSFNVMYLAISSMALKGILQEKNLILEEKLKNTYRKFI